MKITPYQHLGFSIHSLDARHAAMPLLPCHPVRHLLSEINWPEVLETPGDIVSKQGRNRVTYHFICS